MGATAPQAAGVIHTVSNAASSARKTIAYDDFIATKASVAAKEAGKMRAEGKEYVVRMATC